MEQHCRPYQAWVLALDQDTTDALEQLNLPHVRLVAMSQVETKELRGKKADRSKKEYAWTIKASWMQWVLCNAWVPAVLYLDVDCFFFGKPDVLFTEVVGADVAITPHRFAPPHEHFIANGVFNVGCVYVRNSPKGRACIDKWAKQCIAWCYHRHERGLFTEQKYLDTWPQEWEARIVQNLGINLAPWNQEQYRYTLNPQGQIYVTHGDKTHHLIFYHFHEGLTTGYPLHPFVREHIYEPYAQILKQVKKNHDFNFCDV